MDITLEGVMAGTVSPEDIRISRSALLRQAEAAQGAGQTALAENLRRAAELTEVPNEEILAMYNALRPHRSTKAEIESLCNTLETEYGAIETARFIRGCVASYELKGLFKRQDGGG